MIERIPPEIGYYLAGFADAEGSFNVSFIANNEKNKNLSWKVRPCFNVSQKEKHILTFFQKYLDCGTLSTNKNNVTTFSVVAFKDVGEKVVAFKKRFPFESTKKRQDFLNFVQILEILEKPVNTLPISDIERILALRVNTEVIVKNRTYSDQYLLENWPEPTLIEKIKKSSETTMPKSESAENALNDMIESDLCSDTKAANAESFYIAGFADGNGSLNVSFRFRDDYRTAWKISASFSIAQKDELLLKKFQAKLGCGKIRLGSSLGVYYLEVTDQKDLTNKIIPFFKEFQFLSEGNRSRFEKLCKTVDFLSKGPTYSRSDLEELLSSQRDGSCKSKYTAQEILARFDTFSEKR